MKSTQKLTKLFSLINQLTKSVQLCPLTVRNIYYNISTYRVIPIQIDQKRFVSHFPVDGS